MNKSTEERINQSYNSAKFSEINGRILRALNVLDDKKPKLNALITLFNDVEFKEFADSVRYLSLSGYISLIDIYTRKEKPFEIREFDNLALKLTAKGISLLKGKKEDNAVDI
ncbi:MAG: hypothetical protein ACI4Q5_00305 [Porcipelethomonas sp.]